MQLNKNYVIYLSLIILASLVLKLYTVDFSLPVTTDALEYTLHSFAISQGQFLQHPQRHMGWPLAVSPFMSVLNSDDFLDYSNLMRSAGIMILSVAIILVYFLGRKFFNDKYSILLASIFAFEPRINQIAGTGNSEPLFILIMILSFYLIISNKTKFVFLSFALVGFLWWIRPNGFMMFIVLILVYIFNLRKTANRSRNLALCVLIFLVVVSPMLIQRFQQFDDPLYNWLNERMWVGDYAISRSKNIQSENYTPSDFIRDNGISEFIEKFVLAGIYNVLYTAARMTFPYLFVMLPLGILLSLKKIGNGAIRANWILIATTLLILVPTFSLVPDKRHLLYLIPFLGIFGILSVDYILGKNFFKNQNGHRQNICLVGIILAVVISSGLYTSQYERPDTVLEHERMAFAKFMQTMDGNLLFEPTHSQDYFNHPMLYDDATSFKHIRITPNWDATKLYFTYPHQNLDRITIYGKDMEELVANGETHNLKYIMATSEGGSFYQFVDDLYKNESKYPYLTKIYDSNKEGFQKFKVKVFEINYQKFHSYD
jgi:hypothetical protein